MKPTERQLKLLEIIVDEYVNLGTPVSSSQLLKSHNLGISPATIRYEMAALEEMGLLEKPHASGGRIPTSEAFELYITDIKATTNIK